MFSDHLKYVIGNQLLPVNLLLLHLPLKLLSLEHLILLALIIEYRANPLLDPSLSIVLQLAGTLSNHVLPHYSLGHCYIMLFLHGTDMQRLPIGEAQLACTCSTGSGLCIIYQVLGLHVAKFGTTVVVQEVLLGQHVFEVLLNLIQVDVLVLV